jgi:hypothetical protein
MFGAALWNFVAVLRVVRGADSAMSGTAGGLNAQTLNAQVFLFFHSFNDIWSLGLVLFGLHLFLVGYLVFRSGRMPRTLGVLAMLASFCYVATSAANLVLPNYDQYKPTVELFLTAPMAIGELGVGLWLLIKGGKE